MGGGWRGVGWAICVLLAGAVGCAVRPEVEYGSSGECGTFEAEFEDEAEVHRCEASLAFPMSDACAHDGSYEFCLRVGDDQTLTAVRSIWPNARVLGPSAGRAGCDTATEHLVLLPVDSDVCAATGHPDAQTESALCEVATLPGVGTVYATRYE